jgi:hypothetical protein
MYFCIQTDGLARLESGTALFCFLLRIIFCVIIVFVFKQTDWIDWRAVLAMCNP